MTQTNPKPQRFSQRTAWDRGVADFAVRVEEARASRVPLLDLTSTNPTMCGFAFDSAALLTPLADVAGLQYQPEPRGLFSAREAVARYYAGHGAEVAPEQVVLTASTSEAYSHLFRMLCDPGDEVLVAQPGYPLFDYLADLSDVSLRPYPLFYDHGWWIDTAELERRITPRTRALIAVHPNNPTGHATSGAERSILYSLCARHGLSLIVDEVFLDYPHAPTHRIESFAASTVPVLTFVLSGLSKIAALPQMKLGWIAVLGPAAACDEGLARLEIIGDTFLSISTPAQLALPAWLAHAPTTQAQILERIRVNLGLLAAADLAPLDLDAGWSAILRLPRTFPEANAAESLLRRGVLTHPAEFYRLYDPSRVVVSLLVPAQTMRSAITRIVDLVRAGE